MVGCGKGFYTKGIIMQQIYNIVLLIAACGMVAAAVYEGKTKKLLGKQRNYIYTPESMAEFAPIEAVLYAVIAFGMVVVALYGMDGLLGTGYYYLGYGTALTGLVLDIGMSRLRLHRRRDR